LVHSLRRNMGLTTYEAVTREIAEREREGGLIGILRAERMPEVTTRRALDLERANIREVLEGKGTQQPIIAAGQVKQVIDRISVAQAITLNESQREAVEKLLSNRDRIMGLQGRAGTGKTTVLSTLKAAAEEAGYTVRGFAPSTRAAKELSKSGIETITLQKFTFSKRKEMVGDGRTLYVLDESSLASSRLISKFFKRIGPNGRVWMVGDDRQHQAVEAGSPFEQLQKNGMETVKLTQIVRQKDEGLRQVIEKLAERRVRDAVKDLIAQGRVREYTNDKARLRAIAADYCASQGDTLVISPANEERVLLNMMIREELARQGLVGREDHRIKALVSDAEMSKRERAFAGAYNPGSVIRYSHKSKVYQTNAGDYGRVVSRNRRENTITVELMTSGRVFTYDPKRLSGVSVYVEAERDFAVGDRIQFRAPLAAERVANGDFGVIRDISDRQWKVELEGGRVIKFDPNAFRHIDHGYASTSYSSQCATFSRILINADTKESGRLLNQRMGYVGISRAMLEALVYTDSAQKLGEALDRRTDKAIGLEAMAQNRLMARTTGDARGKAAEPYVPQKRASTQKVAAQRATQTDSLAERSKQPATLTRRESKVSRPPRAFTKTVTQNQELYTGNNERRPRQKLIEVKRGTPCPVCNKPRWCSTNEDRTFVICKWVESDRPTKNDKGWVHIFDGDSFSHAPQTMQVQVEVQQYARAEIMKRDEINRKLLSTLELNRRDLKNLLKRGLDEKTIAQNGYRSVPLPSELSKVMESFKDDDLRGIPGFFRKNGKDGAWRLNIGEWTSKKDGVTRSYHQGFLVPVRDIQGRIEGFQVRRVEVRDEDDPRYIWLSSSNKEEGASSRSPIHFRNVEQAQRSGQAIITEGALKADVTSHLLGDRHAFIAVAGVSNFGEDFGRRLREQIPELRQVIIAYDADSARKPKVLQALNRLGETLRGAGLDVRELKWEEKNGKGLDDYLLNDQGARHELGGFLADSLASFDRRQLSVASPVSRDQSTSQGESRPRSQEITL
ncbi:MAG: AAA family ATPase, partial [Blastocatellia bacterium]